MSLATDRYLRGQDRPSPAVVHGAANGHILCGQHPPQRAGLESGRRRTHTHDSESAIRRPSDAAVGDRGVDDEHSHQRQLRRRAGSEAVADGASDSCAGGREGTGPRVVAQEGRVTSVQQLGRHRGRRNG